MEQVEILSDMVEHVLEDAVFRDKKTFKMYEFLQNNKFNRRQVNEFMNSATAENLSITIGDLDLLIEGGHPEVREAYPNLGKPEARKIRNYLHSILQDAWNYEKDKSKRKRRTVSK